MGMADTGCERQEKTMAYHQQPYQPTRGPWKEASNTMKLGERFPVQFHKPTDCSRAVNDFSMNPNHSKAFLKQAFTLALYP